MLTIWALLYSTKKNNKKTNNVFVDDSLFGPNTCVYNKLMAVCWAPAY